MPVRMLAAMDDEETDFYYHFTEWFLPGFLSKEVCGNKTANIGNMAA